MFSDVMRHHVEKVAAHKGLISATAGKQSRESLSVITGELTEVIMSWNTALYLIKIHLMKPNKYLYTLKTRQHNTNIVHNYQLLQTVSVSLHE